MSDFDGGAAAPADAPATSTAPVDTPAAPPNPVSTEREPSPPPEPKEPAKPVSTREALAKAAEKVEKADKEPAKTTEKASSERSEGPTRAEDGKFASSKPAEPAQKPVSGQEAAPAAQTAAKPETGADEAPTRFTPSARAKWASTDPEIRSETQRAVKELTEGLEKYKAGHQANEDLKEFHDLAKQGGTTVKEALVNYTGIEKLLRTDPVAAFEKIAGNIGLSFRDVAAFVLNQAPEQVASQQDAKVRGLESTIAQLQQQVQKLSGTFEQQEASALQAQISQFASDKPRFDELRADMAMLLNSGRASDMTEAYALAERMNPAPAPATPPPARPVAAPDPEAQTLKGSKFIAGAPSAGSNPAARPPSRTSREALQRAFAAAGN